MPLDLTAEVFERLVEEALDALPDDLVEGLENVAVVVEDESPDGEVLFGRYEGVDLTQRGQYGFGELPDRIVVYRRAHLESAATEGELRDELRTTLVHEIGHFFGIDDDRLHELGWG